MKDLADRTESRYKPKVNGRAYTKGKRMWRVENADHLGPYNYKQGIHGANSAPASMYAPFNHPEPNEDPLIEAAWQRLVSNGAHTEYIFGFSSLKSVYLWFNSPDQIAWLKANNFKIAVYRAVGPSLIGKSQVIVRRDDVILVRYLSEQEGGL